MLKNHFIRQIILNLTFTPTENQLIMIGALSDLVVSEDECILMINGYAGTGKTSIVSAFIRVLDSYQKKCILLAPTGRAAKVLSHYAQKTALTVHRKIYRQSSAGRFELDRNLHSDTLFIVDEASLISSAGSSRIFGTGDLLDDLMTYVFSGTRCQLILLGDSAQLTPIGESRSRALDVSVLEGYPVDVRTVFLTEVVRQSIESGIVFNATLLRGKMDNPVDIAPMLRAFPDVIRVQGEELIDAICEAYYKAGEDGVIVITTSNKRAVQFCMGIRNRILYRESELEVGDRLMIVKNNYFWTEKIKEFPFLANGESVEVVRVRKHYEMYELRFADVLLRLDEGTELEVRVVLDSLLSETAALTESQMQKMVEGISEDYGALSVRELKHKLRSDPFFNALQVKFSYAITCHKAQGGQWDIVFIDYVVFNRSELNMEDLKWLYTSITRAVKQVYLVNFPDHYFEQ